MHLAAFNGREGVVRLLIAAGAEIGIRGYQGRTPLSYAEAKGHAAAVRIIKAAEADAKTSELAGRTLSVTRP